MCAILSFSVSHSNTLTCSFLVFCDLNGNLFQPATAEFERLASLIETTKTAWAPMGEGLVTENRPRKREIFQSWDPSDGKPAVQNL
uniref:Uncharacterized protein n=1 Tax=Ascaris lumbricoides TaxID=6252 RepID=A0A0M3I5K9_ASCLU